MDNKECSKNSIKKKEPCLKSEEEKRKKEREKKRRQREKIKNNPEAREKFREKYRENYQYRKACGKIKLIAELTPQEQIQKRNEWKASMKQFRQKKKQLKEILPENNSASTPLNSKKIEDSRKFSETSDCCDSSFLEPEIVIKEEPIDNSEDATPSRLDHEFILPCTDSYQSCSTPAIKEAFSVVKTEPLEEPQQITSNCRTTKPNKRQTSGTADVAKQINTNGRTTKPSLRKTVEKNNVVELTENRPTDENAATSNTNSSKDSFDVYGEYIAAKLRNLDLNSCLYVQKAFADILFDAEMGKFK